MRGSAWATLAIAAVMAGACALSFPDYQGGLGGGGSTTATTTSSGTGTSTTGVGCNANMCTIPGDCPMPPLCFSRGCSSDGCCTLDPAPPNSVCATGYPATCDGNGNCRCNGDIDCPMFECQTALCGGSGFCEYIPSTQGTTCMSSGTCNADGGCSL